MKLSGLSIVLPAFDEEDNIRRAVKNAAAFARRHADRWEVIVINDGSADGTADLLVKLKSEIPGLVVESHEKNMGYGAALSSGFRAARLEWVFTTDADNQFDINELALFLPFTARYDFLMGYRKNRQDSFARKFLAWGFNLLAGWMFKINVKDVDCAFKLIRRSVLEKMGFSSSDFFIDTELIARARRLGCRIYQRAVTHYPRTAGRTTVRPSDIPRTLREMAGIYRKIKRQA
ncbi:MAG: glycosyltransferase family 2 protein [Planctomycetota bacterium]